MQGPTNIPTDWHESLGEPGRIGHYRLLETLGEGGMGIVYKAEQTEPVRRIVALKLIKLGMDTKQVIARFESERQALAMMNHPNVAKALDAGITDDGRPYFVMEHVPGVPITQYCDAHRLTLDERLELFIDVCHAVQHAHQNGIIHRDIKPSNVLVCVEGEEAIPKVIDFGVAKATGPRLTEKTLFTEQGQMIGTPEYMSPEQAEMTGLNVDTRSDIYSLGALLYELLVGALPFDPSALRRAGIAEIQRTIREVDPPRPSTRVTTLEMDEQEEVARSRRSSRPGIQRELRSDLDWIILKAMDKDRTRRYATANGLASDIMRHLKSEPVVARPPTTLYRVQKFMRRNRPIVIGTAAVFVALVAGIIGTTVQRVAAVNQASEKGAISQFLDQMLTDPDPIRGRGKDVTFLAVIEKASAELDRSFEGAPLVEAHLRTTLGTTLRELGQLEAAGRHLRRARELRVDRLGASDPLTLETLFQLGELRLDEAEYDEARQLHEEVLRRRLALLGPRDRRTLQSKFAVAKVLHRRHDWEEARALYEEVYEHQRDLTGEGRRDTIRTMNALASVYVDLRRFEDAERMYRRAIEAGTEVFEDDPDHPLIVLSRDNLALLYTERGRYRDAEPLARRQYELCVERFDADHLHTANSAANLAALLQELRRYDEADALFNLAYARWKDEYGPEHQVTLAGLSNLAEFEYKRALYGRRTPEQRRADLRAARGRIDEAIAAGRRRLPGDHVYLGIFLMWRARILLALDDPAGAAESAREATEILEPWGSAYKYTILASATAAEVALARGETGAALASIEAAVENGRATFGADHPETGRLLLLQGRILAASGRAEDAKRALAEARDILVTTYGQEDVEVAMVDAVRAGP